MAKTRATPAAKSTPTQAAQPSTRARATSAKKAAAKRDKPGPTPFDYEKLSKILHGQKLLGNYPLTIKRLLDLAGMPWPGEAPLVGAEASRHWMTSAKASAKQATLEKALVFSPDDLGRITGHARLWQELITAQVDGRPEACSADAMVKGCSDEFAGSVSTQINTRFESRQLPPGIGAVVVGKKTLYFIFDHIVGSPAPAARSLPGPSTESGPRPSASPLRTTEVLTAPATLAARMQAAFDRIDHASGRNNQVLLFDLRHALDGVSREEFDACLEQLRRERVLTLAPDEGRFGPIAREQSEAGVPGSNGRLVYAARM